MSSGSSTGQILGYIVGAVAGYFTGGASYVLMGAALGGAVGGAIDPPKGPHIEGPRLNDLSVQTATYGAVIPRVYGTVALMGNIFWLENNQLQERSKTESQGGKGGGGGAESTTYSYYATFAVGLCEGPIAGVRRIWVGSKLIYDAGSDDMATIIASNATGELFTVHKGTEDQSPDDRMQATLGVANTPAYRGLAYVVFKDYPLAEHGNSLLGAQVKVEVVNAETMAFSSSTMSGMEPTFWNGIAANDLALVAIKGGSTCRISRDFVSWSSTTPVMPYSGAWNDIAVFKERFLCVMSGKFASSISGDNWTGGEMPMSIDYYALAPSDNRLFALANNSQYAAYTDTAATPNWKSVTLPASRDWVATATNNVGTFVALARNVSVISVSTDNCETWSDVPLPQSSDWLAVVFNGSVFFAINKNGHSSAVSSDGLIWSAAPAFAPTAYIALTADLNSGRILVVITSTLRSSLDNGASFSTNSIVNENYTSACALGDVAWAATVGAFALRLRFKNTGDLADLGDIVSAETMASQIISSSDIDVSALTQPVRGYRIASVAAIRSAIEPLQGAWPFDALQSGYKIKFKPRGGAAVATVPAIDLDSREAGKAGGVSITVGREMDSILPARVILKHIDVNREYDQGEQYAERLNTSAVNISTVEMPIVMTAGEAAANVEMLLYLYWLERYDVSFSLPPTYNGLEPADVITINATTASYELRLTAINYTSDGRLECTAKYNAAAIYSPTALGEEGLSTGAVLTLTGGTAYALLDIPLLLDVTDLPGFPVAMTGYLTGWPGGTVFRSDDAGQTWANLQTFVAPGAAMGSAGTALGSGRLGMFDQAAVLSVSLISGALSSVTEAALLNGANHFAYGAHGRWEIIAAKTCTLQGDGSYVLTDLLRGRFGSEHACASHVTGDSIVLLDSNKLAFVTANLNTIGASRTYRGITAGKAMSTDSDKAFTYTGVNLECLAPVYLNGNRHPTTNDWSLDWIRRTRIGGEWRDYVDATLGETTQSYEVEIYSSVAYTTLKRTITGLATPAASYTSAQQVTDFGSNQATLYVKVYQLSSNVGRGYPLTTSITR